MRRSKKPRRATWITDLETSIFREAVEKLAKVFDEKGAEREKGDSPFLHAINV